MAEQNSTGKTVKECNFPDCRRKPIARGLCDKHYWQATKSATPAVKAEAQKYMSPAKRGVNKSRAAPAANPVPAPVKKPRKAFNPDIDTSEPLTIGALSDEARAAVHESYISLGAKHVRFPDGSLYVFPDSRQSIWIGPEGRIEAAEIHKGPNKEKIA
jgi:hypothetical protein